MNSERPIRYYQKLIKAIFAQINEEFLSRKVDAPLQAAAKEFQFNESELLTYENFLKLVGAFIQQVFTKGCGARRQLTEQQATAEAIMLLEAGYPGNPQERLDNAFLDAKQFGVSHVFSFLVSSISASTKVGYASWVLKSSLNPLTWNEKKIVVRLIFNDWQQYLPHHLQDYSPEIFANQIPELIRTINDITQQTRQYFQNDTKHII